ncbi:hypothetical protein [Iamia sp.]|uniref:hypothetical protein n=1 Tax=Iamia sp. TaxID=2722710 RepID=UPI002C125C94|nr:hypothetical protein [Iamia sp.]HXH58432.1 hypothetical protein [Iamia sp.]
MALIEGETSPELSDLMEHEKVIEQGLATFIDVGWALMQIRDGRKYRAIGFDTFEAYCQDRWDLTRQHANRLIAATGIVGDLEPRGSIPTSEKQVRPLAALPDPEARSEAWEEAVEEAGGQPTAKQVAKAVAKRTVKKKEHPAPFSDPILDTIAKRVDGSGTVLDPFAGTGRVHELRDRAEIGSTVGVELEPEWAAKHPDTIEGNALDLPLGDGEVDAIATSPTYGNRMADHHDATDDSARHTYKHTLGHDLHEDNSGSLQWGDEYRAFHLRAWTEAVRVLRPGGLFVINVKDHIRGGDKQEVVAWHLDTVGRTLGLELIALDVVPTRGLMAGQNHDKRTVAEIVATFRKAAA